MVVGGGGSWDRDEVAEGYLGEGWPEVAIFGGSLLVPGRAGGRSEGPALLLSVIWIRTGVMRVAAAS